MKLRTQPNIDSITEICMSRGEMPDALQRGEPERTELYSALMVSSPAVASEKLKLLTPAAPSRSLAVACAATTAPAQRVCQGIGLGGHVVTDMSNADRNQPNQKSVARKWLSTLSQSDVKRRNVSYDRRPGKSLSV